MLISLADTLPDHVLRYNSCPFLPCQAYPAVPIPRGWMQVAVCVNLHSQLGNCVRRGANNPKVVPVQEVAVHINVAMHRNHWPFGRHSAFDGPVSNA
eukprot:845272-Amphidinium_carterae.1